MVLKLFASDLPCGCKRCTKKGLDCGSLEGHRTQSCPACVAAKARCIRDGDKDRPVKRVKLGKSIAEVINLNLDEDAEPTSGPSGLKIRLSRPEKNTTGLFFGSKTHWSAQLEEEMSDQELMIRLLTEVQELRVEYRREALVGQLDALERHLAAESEGCMVAPVIRDSESAEEEEEGSEPE